MARTPPFRALERSLRLARLELATGRPAAELEGEARRRRPAPLARPPSRSPSRPLSRRDVVRTAAVAAAGAGLTGCRTLAPAGGGIGAPEVVIAGAGIAGLTAAYRLARAGVAVRVLEAQERIGGRMFSLRAGERAGNLHFAGEHTADDGQGFMEGGCESGERVAAEILAGLGRERVAA